YAFFDPLSHGPDSSAQGVERGVPGASSLNTLGYSPILLVEYLSFIKTISDGLPAKPSPLFAQKYFIVSVTGSPEDVAGCYRLIAEHSRTVRMPLAVEVNLSCPNIPGRPPPAYSGEELSRYLAALRGVIEEGGTSLPRLPIGLKTPPYTYGGQFEALVTALRGSTGTAGASTTASCLVSFLTATNTLGSCLVLSGDDADAACGQPRLAAPGIGGMAGASLHPLALGNVATLRRLLDQEEGTRGVAVIGVGGVEDVAGYRRMQSVGAAAVGVGTALGRKGLKVFEDIQTGLDPAAAATAPAS
ncbi:hypothetical protein BX600DRAFT_457591, partial [Xylariales sp. PMI_506]